MQFDAPPPSSGEMKPNLTEKFEQTQTQILLSARPLALDPPDYLNNAARKTNSEAIAFPVLNSAFPIACWGFAGVEGSSFATMGHFAHALHIPWKIATAREPNRPAGTNVLKIGSRPHLTHAQLEHIDKALMDVRSIFGLPSLGNVGMLLSNSARVVTFWPKLPPKPQGKRLNLIVSHDPNAVIISNCPIATLHPRQ